MHPRAFHILIFVGVLAFASSTLAEPPARKPSRITIASFWGLPVGITYEEILRRIGPPDEEVGCCSYVYRYYLADGSIILVTTPDRNEVVRVTHVVGDALTELLPNVD